jgi:hypothetical protein
MCMPRPACQSDRPAEPPPDPPLSLLEPPAYVESWTTHRPAAPFTCGRARRHEPPHGTERRHATHGHISTTHARVSCGTWNVACFDVVVGTPARALLHRIPHDAMRGVYVPPCAHPGRSARRATCGEFARKRAVGGGDALRAVDPYPSSSCCWSLFLRGERVGGSDFGGADSLVAVLFFTEGGGSCFRRSVSADPFYRHHGSKRWKAKGQRASRLEAPQRQRERGKKTKAEPRTRKRHDEELPWTWLLDDSSYIRYRKRCTASNELLLLQSLHQNFELPTAL